MTDEPTTPPRRTYRRLLGYVRPYRWVLIVGILAGCVTGGSSAGLLTSLPNVVKAFNGTTSGERLPLPLGLEKVDFVRRLVETVNTHVETLHAGQITAGVLLVSILVLLGFYVLKEGTGFLNRYCTRWVGVHAVKDLRNQLYGHLLRQSLRFHGRSGGLKTRRQDKGHLAELEAFGRAVREGGEWPIPLWQQVQATRIALRVEQLLGGPPAEAAS